MEYLLTAKFVSDLLEGRFGWYRQVSGGNLFILLKSLLLVDKIQYLTFLQQEALLSASSLKYNNRVDDFGSCNTTQDYLWLTEFLFSIALDDIDQNDSLVAYFVAGCIGRSIARRKRCTLCKETLITCGEFSSLKDCLPADHQNLFEMTDRGNLSTPSE